MTYHVILTSILFFLSIFAILIQSLPLHPFQYTWVSTSLRWHQIRQSAISSGDSGVQYSERPLQLFYGKPWRNATITFYGIPQYLTQEPLAVMIFAHWMTQTILLISQFTVHLWHRWGMLFQIWIEISKRGWHIRRIYTALERQDHEMVLFNILGL